MSLKIDMYIGLKPYESLHHASFDYIIFRESGIMRCIAVPVRV